MLRRFLIIIFLFGLFSQAWSLSVTSRIIDAINSVRMDPVGVASEYGIDYDSMISLWGSNFDSIIYGLMPLKRSEVLEREAEDFIDRLVSGQASLDEQPSYTPGVVLSSRIVTFMAFEHMVNRDEALQILLSNVLLEAISANGTPSSLLFPIFTDMGAVLKGIRVKIGGAYYNVYVLVIDVGIAEHVPEGTYIVGKVQSDDGAIFVSKDRKLVKPVKWPSGLYFAPVSPGFWYVSREISVDGRKVRAVYKVGEIVPGANRFDLQRIEGGQF